jgi:fructose-1,6-bisphosphatase
LDTFCSKIHIITRNYTIKVNANRYALLRSIMGNYAQLQLGKTKFIRVISRNNSGKDRNFTRYYVIQQRDITRKFKA